MNQGTGEESMDLEPTNQCLGRVESQIRCTHGESPKDDGNKALNASFDSSMLRQSRGEASCLVNNQRLRAAASWDEREGVTDTDGPHHAAHLDMPVLPPSASGAERNLRLGNDFVAAEGTPVRLRFKPPGTARKGKLTPASAKRRKAPVHHHPLHQHPSRTRSPLHRGSACKPTRVSATSSALTNRSLAVETPWPLPGPLPQLQATRQKPFVTSSALETTSETFESSADASLESSTPFRFTSFPASLPRIHNLPMRHVRTATNGECSGTNPDYISCPPTVRKRMSFGGTLGTQRSSHPAAASQDSSFSSLLLDCGDDQRDQHSYPDVALPQPLQAPNTCLDASTEAQLMGTPRARLNFSSTSSPISMQEGGGMQVDEDVVKSNGPYEAYAANSFTSSVSSFKHDDGIFPFAHSSTPARAPAAVFLPSSTTRPQTPREMSLHFQLDAAQCSPIPGIPEEDADLSSSKSSCQVSSSSLKRQQNTASYRLSTSRDSDSTDRSGGQRKSRPMPDMMAFEGDGSASSRDRSFDESSKSAGSKHPSSSPRRQCPPTPVRTPAWAHSEAGGGPIFKPGGLKRYSRSNSLIATKVLATCSPHVLDGRASLESSLGDSRESHEDRSKSGELSDDDTVVDDAADSGNGILPHIARINEPKAADGAIPSARRESLRGVGEAVSMGTHFDVLSTLGKGTFADVFRVRSRMDGRLYAVKRNRRQFRGTRDREKALAEVKCMQRLQSFGDKHERPTLSYSMYILFFYQAWQEDGYFFCQTELCCRDTCRDLHESLRANWSISKTRYKSLSKLPATPSEGSNPSLDGRLFPEHSLWKILHDVAAGLSHIHSHGLVHFDIKPSNLFFVPHVRFGAITKIGDFGMAGEIGSSEDGQEGDQLYMAGELLSSDRKHPSADIFSSGLALFELASNLSFVLPSEGPRWHQLRMGRPPTSSDIPTCRSPDLVSVIHSMISVRDERPTAESILQIAIVQNAGMCCDEFLRDYLLDIEEFDRREEQTSGFAFHEDQTPRHAHTTGRSLVCSPTAYFLPKLPLLSSPEAAHS